MRSSTSPQILSGEVRKRSRVWLTVPSVEFSIGTTPKSAAEVYGLKVLAAQIEDRGDNTTRFLVLGRRLLAASGRDRTTLLVSVGHTDAPGALHRLLEPLARHRVSMTRIESRPSHRRKWDYVFFIDVDGHAEEPHVARALAALKQRASLFRLLGSYPRAVL